MYDYFLPPAARNFIDSMFSPLLSVLQYARDYLYDVALIAGHGINLNNYFGFFSYLPGPLQAVVNSLIASIVLLAMLQVVKVIIRLYFSIKDGFKFW